MTGQTPPMAISPSGLVVPNDFERGSVARLGDHERRIARLESVPSGPTMGEFYATFLGLPLLRGFWPMSSVDNALVVYDLSGQGRHLTGVNTPGFSVTNTVVSYVDTNGTTIYLARADEAGLEFAGSFTIGGWFKFKAALATGAGIFGKYATAANNRSYELSALTGDTIRFGVSTDGININNIDSAVVSLNVWHFVVGRLTTASELAIFVDNAKLTTATAIVNPFNSSAALELARRNVAGTFTNLSAGPLFLCAAALSDAALRYLWSRSRVLFGV